MSALLPSWLFALPSCLASYEVYLTYGICWLCARHETWSLTLPRHAQFCRKTGTARFPVFATDKTEKTQTIEEGSTEERGKKGRRINSWNCSICLTFDGAIRGRRKRKSIDFQLVDPLLLPQTLLCFCSVFPLQTEPSEKSLTSILVSIPFSHRLWEIASSVLQSPMGLQRPFVVWTERCFIFSNISPPLFNIPIFLCQLTLL